MLCGASKIPCSGSTVFIGSRLPLAVAAVVRGRASFSSTHHPSPSADRTMPFKKLGDARLQRLRNEREADGRGSSAASGTRSGGRSLPWDIRPAQQNHKNRGRSPERGPNGSKSRSRSPRRYGPSIGLINDVLPRRWDPKLKIAHNIASSEQACIDAENHLVDLVVNSASDETNTSRVRTYTVIVNAARLEPWPLTFKSVLRYLSILVAAEYKTVDDSLSVITSYAKEKRVYNLSIDEWAIVEGLLRKIKKLGLLSHDQKAPITLEQIESTKDRAKRGKQLLLFYTGMRKSEAAQVGGSIAVTFDIDDTVLVDFRKAALKSRAGACAVRLSCVCKSSRRLCLHSYRDVIEGCNGIDAVECAPKVEGVASHSFRIGCLLHQMSMERDMAKTVLHMRWSTVVMWLYYARRKALFRKPKKFANLKFWED